MQRCAAALLLVSSVALTADAQPSQIVNGRVEVRQAAAPLERELATLAARGETMWVAYRVPTVPGASRMCAHDTFRQARVLLEPPTEITVLVRLEARRVVKVQSATPDCEVDAGGLSVAWMNGIAVDDSASWLAAQVRSTETAGQREAHIVRPALLALTWHAGEPALRSLIGFARTDARSRIRSQALFWLGQRAGRESTAAIREAVENDPETEVKKKAVFALSQLPKDEGVPLLIAIARTHANREVRRQAFFWLGQSNDPRALTFFEDVLK